MMCANLQLTDYVVDGQPERDDVAVVSAPLSDVLTGELDGAAAALGLTAEEILLAALGRTIVRTIGDGVVVVDLQGHAVTRHPVELVCTGPAVTSASEMLAAVHRAVAALSLHRMVHEVPGGAHAQPVADALLVHEGSDDVSEPAGLGHALELRTHRRDGTLVLDWWYDARRFEAYTVEEMSEQFAYGLIELTSEATAPVIAGNELAMTY